MSASTSSSMPHTVETTTAHSRVGLLLSLGIHVAVFGGAWVYAHMAPPRVVPLKPMTARLVALGSPTPPGQLPHRASSGAKTARNAAATPPPGPASPAPEAPAGALPDPRSLLAPSPVDKLSSAVEREKSLTDALARLGTGTPAPAQEQPHPTEGAADGVAHGTATGVKPQDYLDLVRATLQAGYTLPRHIQLLSDERKARLVCRIYLRIDAGGDITEARVTEASDDPRFDAAVLGYIQRLDHIRPAPPPSLVDTLRDEGVELAFSP